MARRPGTQHGPTLSHPLPSRHEEPFPPASWRGGKPGSGLSEWVLGGEPLEAGGKPGQDFRQERGHADPGPCPCPCPARTAGGKGFEVPPGGGEGAGRAPRPPGARGLGRWRRCGPRSGARVTCEEGRKSRKAGRLAASWEFSARRGRRELGLPGEPGTRRRRRGPGSETAGAARRVRGRERQRRTETGWETN